jgi:chromosome partitioning protein
MNYKGGVGKTTLAANIGAGLAALGRRVLLIDLDPQSNLTFCFYPPLEWDQDIRTRQTIKLWFDAHLTERAHVPRLSTLVLNPPRAQSHLPANAGELGLISSDLSLIDIDMKLYRALYNENSDRARSQQLRLHRILADALEDEENAGYDYVLIDCAPDFGIVNRIAVVASDFLLIPAKADHLSTLGISHLVGSVGDLVSEYHRMGAAAKRIKPQVLGVVFNMIQNYSKKPIAAQRDIVQRTTKDTLVPVFETTIRNAPGSAIRSTTDAVPAILTPADDGEFALELTNLTKEFLRRTESEKG